MDNNPTEFFTTAGAHTPEGTAITAGKTTIYGLTKGTYVLRETKAPDGYELTKDVIFTMTADGKVKDVTTCTVGEYNKINRDSSGDTVVTLMSSGTGTAIVNTMIVKDTPIEVSLTKKLLSNVDINSHGDASYEITGIFSGKTTQETRTFNGNTITEALKAQLIGGHDYTIGLQSVTFMLYKQQADGSYLQTGTEYTTGGNGLLHIDLTEKGTYKLVETDGLGMHSIHSEILCSGLA